MMKLKGRISILFYVGVGIMGFVSGFLVGKVIKLFPVLVELVSYEIKNIIVR